MAENWKLFPAARIGAAKWSGSPDGRAIPFLLLSFDIFEWFATTFPHSPFLISIMTAINSWRRSFDSFGIVKKNNLSLTGFRCFYQVNGWKWHTCDSELRRNVQIIVLIARFIVPSSPSFMADVLLDLCNQFCNRVTSDRVLSWTFSSILIFKLLLMTRRRSIKCYGFVVAALGAAGNYLAFRINSNLKGIWIETVVISVLCDECCWG